MLGVIARLRAQGEPFAVQRRGAADWMAQRDQLEEEEKEADGVGASIDPAAAAAAFVPAADLASWRSLLDKWADRARRLTLQQLDKIIATRTVDNCKTMHELPSSNSFVVSGCCSCS